MTEEQALAQATQNIENAKPMLKQLGNNEVVEYSEEDYAQAIIDNKNFILDNYFNSYIQARQEAYGSITDQLDMMYWDGVNGTTTWADHIAQVKSDNPKPA